MRSTSSPRPPAPQSARRLYRDVKYPSSVCQGVWLNQVTFQGLDEQIYWTTEEVKRRGLGHYILEWTERPCRWLGRKIVHEKVERAYTKRSHRRKGRGVMVYLKDDVLAIIKSKKEGKPTISETAPVNPFDDRGPMLTDNEMQKKFPDLVNPGFCYYWSHRKSTVPERAGQPALRSDADGVAGSRYGRRQVKRYSLVDVQRILAGKEGAGTTKGRTKRRKSNAIRQNEESTVLRETLITLGPMPVGKLKAIAKAHGIAWERVRKIRKQRKVDGLPPLFFVAPVGGRQYYAYLPSQKRQLPQMGVEETDRETASKLKDLITLHGPMRTKLLCKVANEAFELSPKTLYRIWRNCRELDIPLVRRRIGTVSLANGEPETLNEVGSIAASNTSQDAEPATSGARWNVWWGIEGQNFPESDRTRRLRDLANVITDVLTEFPELTTLDLKQRCRDRGAELSSDDLSVIHRKNLANISVRQESANAFPRVFLWSHFESDASGSQQQCTKYEPPVGWKRKKELVELLQLERIDRATALLICMCLKDGRDKGAIPAYWSEKPSVVDTKVGRKLHEAWFYEPEAALDYLRKGLDGGIDLSAGKMVETEQTASSPDEENKARRNTVVAENLRKLREGYKQHCGESEEKRSIALAEYDRLMAETPELKSRAAEKLAGKKAGVSDRQVRRYLEARNA